MAYGWRVKLAPLRFRRTASDKILSPSFLFCRFDIGRALRSKFLDRKCRRTLAGVRRHFLMWCSLRCI